MSKKYFIVGGSRYGEPRVLANYGYEQVHVMTDADFVVFTGGADINPALYGEKPHHTVYFNATRDTLEVAEYKRATGLGKALLGICRGAQLMNVMAGGALYQDISHPSYHEIVTDSGERFMSNSVHHQMLRVAEGAIIKAWAENLSPNHFYMSGDEEAFDVDVAKEPEVVIYPKHRMVLVQGHPEFGHNEPGLETFRQFVFNLLNEELDK